MVPFGVILWIGNTERDGDEISLKTIEKLYKLTIKLKEVQEDIKWKLNVTPSPWTQKYSLLTFGTFISGHISMGKNIQKKISYKIHSTLDAWFFTVRDINS